MKNIIITILLVIMICSVSSCRNAQKDIENNNADTVGETETVAEKESETIEFFKTDEETFVIETAYCPLKYPVKWQNYVAVENTQLGDTAGVSFTAVFGEERFSLYTVAFGNAMGGYKLGTVSTDGGDVEIYLVDTYNSAIETTSEENRDMYYQMCEDVNVIISKLVYDNGMVLAD